MTASTQGGKYLTGSGHPIVRWAFCHITLLPHCALTSEVTINNRLLRLLIWIYLNVLVTTSYIRVDKYTI